MVINLCFNYFNEKTCWTSQILGEYSWQLLFALMRRLKWLRRWRLPPEEKLINNECQFFSRIFSKDFWSSASFLIEMVKTKIDHNKPYGNSFIIKNDIERSPCYPTGKRVGSSVLTSNHYYLLSTTTYSPSNARWRHFSWSHQDYYYYYFLGL